MCKLDPRNFKMGWDGRGSDLNETRCTGKETVEHFSDEIMMVKASQVVWKSRTDSNGFSFALSKIIID